MFSMNPPSAEAYLPKESLERLWFYRYERAMLRYLQEWINQLRWQRLRPFEKLARMLLDHLDGILNCGRTRCRWEWSKQLTAISKPCCVVACC